MLPLMLKKLPLLPITNREGTATLLLLVGGAQQQASCLCSVPQLCRQQTGRIPSAS
jgi:hypothetical protein